MAGLLTGRGGPQVLTDNFASGTEAYQAILDNQEALLFVVATAGVMQAVGQDQGLGPDEGKAK